MKIRALLMPALMFFFALLSRAAAHQSEPPTNAAPEYWSRVKSTIEGYLGRPYSWGACGRKSFDCSGFVWRVMADNGVLFKRTTARKLYMSLPGTAAGQKWDFGNIIFFDNLKHCGIVNDDKSFYHATPSVGTNLANFTPFWRSKTVGVRCSPQNRRR